MLRASSPSTAVQHMSVYICRIAANQCCAEAVWLVQHDAELHLQLLQVMRDDHL